MPFSKFNSKRNAKRKRTTKAVARRGRLAIPRGFRPSVHYFTRRTVETINMTDPSTWPSYWGVPELAIPGVAGVQSFKLADVVDVTDFTALFTQYKLMGIDQKIYCSATNSDAQASGNRQCMFMYKPNPTGNTPPLDEQHFLTSQTSKTRNLVNGGRAVSLRIPLKLHSALYGGVVTTSYATTGPKWLDCEDTTVPHYGLQFRFQPCFDANVMPSIYLKIITTYRIACKEVR